ncbi:MAG TPA: RNA polymerase sigma factor [Gemmatimonadaceae bacterium]|jgi:RNA polymerase sigma-70 factor (ECF subfamily)|nr:RNA polymerase sigma factor [Gemmatimonadaceae bacterium]
MPLEAEATSTDERTLLAHAASGSQAALAALFTLHSSQVHRVAYRLTMSADDADDIVQDVFIGLPEALSAFSGSGDFAAWLRKVAVRTTLMRMRAGKRRSAVAVRAGSETEAAMSNFLLDRMAIATALIALPNDLRVAFMLRDVEGFSHAEIASMLGIRTGTAEVRVHRARRKLRTLLGER